MKYYTLYNGQQQGPFSADDVRERLASGQLSLSDLGWHEGAVTWSPLSDLGFASSSPVLPPVLSGPPQLSSINPVSNRPAWAEHLGKITLGAGVVGLLSLGVLAIPAVVFGHWARERIKSGQASGAKHCMAGLICGYVGVVALVGSIGQIIEGEDELSTASVKELTAGADRPAENKKSSENSPPAGAVNEPDASVGRPAENKTPPENKTPRGEVCDQFELRAQATRSGLNVSLKTDLSDEVEVKLWISRNYYQDGTGLIQADQNEAYSIDYVSLVTKAADWNNPKSFEMSDSAWIAKLRQKQQKWKFGVRSIDQKVNIRLLVTVPVIKKMGITGKAVGTDEFGLKLISQELIVDRPLGVVTARQTVPVNALDLKQARTYRVTTKGDKRTAVVLLMPAASFKDASAGRKLFNGPAKQLLSGGTITVLEIRPGATPSPMYRVRAKDPQGNDLGMAWVNSIALLAQTIVRVQ